MGNEMSAVILAEHVLGGQELERKAGKLVHLCFSVYAVTLNI